MKISEHEEFRRQVFETSPLPIVVMDAETNLIIDCNLAAIKIFGYDLKEKVIGKTTLDFSAPFQYDDTLSSEKAFFYLKKAQRDGSVTFDWKHQPPMVQPGMRKCISVTATDSRVLQASDSFKTIIGVSGHDIRGITMQELFPADFTVKVVLCRFNMKRLMI